MKGLLYFGGVFLGAMLCGCSESPLIIPEDNAEIEWTTDDELYNALLAELTRTWSYTLTSAVLVDDAQKIELTINYPGACTDHTFKLLINQKAIDENNSKSPWLVTHERIKDKCQVDIESTFLINLAALPFKGKDYLTDRPRIVNVSTANNIVVPVTLPVVEKEEEDSTTDTTTN